MTNSLASNLLLAVITVIVVAANLGLILALGTEAEPIRSPHEQAISDTTIFGASHNLVRGESR
ncbi:hypothetical protein FHS96_005305 [Sphingomonas zeicaulis]|uniref:hypothetical protein n=1 Tax=Sphingomonas zeicaulis TaxID=1632740 RepID=UPI003D260AED